MEARYLYREQRSQKRRKFKAGVSILLLLLAGGVYWWSQGLPISIQDTISRITLNSSRPVGGKIIEIKHVGSLTPAQVDAEAKAVYPGEGLEPARRAVEKYEVTYTTRDPRDNSEINVKARYYLPFGGSQVPIFAFGPGTSGPGPLCAPSLERSRGKNWGRYDNHLAFYAGQGYAVATTDYDGRLGQNSIHHYFVGELEGRAMWDMVRALKQFKDPDRFRGDLLGDTLFVAGYSQGGHAALWTQQIQEDYASGMKIDGIIGFAPSTDLHKTLYDLTAGANAVWLPPYLFAAYDDYYGMNTSAGRVFKEPFAANIDRDARTYCIDEAEKTRKGPGHWGELSAIDQLYTPEFLAALRNRTLDRDFPEWSQLLEKNLAGRPIDIPVLIVSGRKDPVILASAQEELARRLCAGGSANVQWVLSDEDHYTKMFEAGRSKVLSWMQTIEAGVRPVSECHRYRA